MTRARNRFRNPARVRTVVLGLAACALIGAGALAWQLRARVVRDIPPQEVIAAYFDDLDFRRHEAAFARLDPETRGRFKDVQFGWRWTGGLVASYGKLVNVDVTPLRQDGAIADFSVTLRWLTPLDVQEQSLTVRTVQRGGAWYLAPTVLRPVQTPLLLQRQETLELNVVGRRQPRPETDLHRDRLDRPRIAISGARLVRHGDRVAVIGQVTNADADPAHVSLTADLIGQTQVLAQEAAGLVSAHRLLPAETAGFRIDFEGVLSLQDARAGGEYDPTLFIPPELPEPPQTASLTGRALVTGKDLYRGISLNGIRSRVEGEQLVVTGLAVNTGTETASIVALNLLLYGPDGRPLWTDSGTVPANIYPGQSAPFRVSLPLGASITVLHELSPADITANGRTQEPDLSPPDASAGTIPLPPASGFSAVRILATSMTHDPLF